MEQVAALRAVLRNPYTNGGQARDAHPVWVYAEPWLVAEGTLPLVERGQRLPDIALMASCVTVEPASGPDGVVYDSAWDLHSDPSQHCRVTGTVEWSHQNAHVGSRMVLKVNDFRIFAEPASEPEPPPGVPHQLALVFPPPQTRVSVRCRLSICPVYVLEDLQEEAPDPRSEWLVERIQLEQRDLVWHGPPGREWATTGDKVRAVDIESMQASDEPEGLNSVYRLDLRPVRA